MLNVQNYLLTNGKNALQQLADQFGIVVRQYPDEALIVLNYSQIDSPKYDPLTMECRGLILDANYRVVSRSFDRFFNYGENGCPQIDFKKVCVMEKVDGCFLYNTPIRCWDGSTVKIGDIVKKGIRPVLVGMDDEGNLVPSFIEDGVDHGRKDNWIDISLDTLSGVHPAKMRVTTNHHIMVNGEYKPADEVCVGDIMTKAIRNFSNKTLHFIKSSLLGDGYVGFNGLNSCKFEVGHSTAKEFDYLKWKHSVFGDLARKIRSRTSGYGSDISYFSSKTLPGLIKTRHEWYTEEGKKRLPEDLSWIDDFSVAIWYMDDGHLSTTEKQKDRAIFSSNAFSLDECNRLSKILEDKYCVSCTVFQNKGWSIRINAGKNNEIAEFWKRIAPFVHPSMARKLPVEYRHMATGVDFTAEEVWDTIDVVITSVDHVVACKENFSHGRKGFDIQTSTQNYFALNVCVHNSLIKTYHYRNQWHVSTRGTAFAESNVNGFDLTFRQLVLKALGNIDDQSFQDWANFYLDQNNTYIFEVTAIENQVVRRYEGYTLWLLGCRTNRNGEYINVDDLDIPLTKNPRRFTFDSIEHCMEVCKSLPDLEEGYVLYDVDSLEPLCKIKSPNYIAAHLIKGEGLNPKRICQVILFGEVDEYLAYFPDDKRFFDPYIDKLNYLMDTLSLLYFDVKDIPDQKEFALKVKDHPLSAVLFQARQKQVNCKAGLLHIFNEQSEAYKLKVLM